MTKSVSLYDDNDPEDYFSSKISDNAIQSSISASKSNHDEDTGDLLGG
jgi:hypothetical protein